jgi:sugar phosphate isomerase/epimerase
MLEPIYENNVNHIYGLKTLEQRNYKHWISIEMKQTNNEYEDIKHSLQFLKGVDDGIIM